MAPVVDRLKAAYEGKVEFKLYDVEKDKQGSDLANSLGVQYVPTFVFVSSDGAIQQIEPPRQERGLRTRPVGMQRDHAQEQQALDQPHPGQLFARPRRQPAPEQAAHQLVVRLEVDPQTHAPAFIAVQVELSGEQEVVAAQEAVAQLRQVVARVAEQPQRAE